MGTTKERFRIEKEQLVAMVENLKQSVPGSDVAIRMAFTEKIYGHIMRRANNDQKAADIILENVFSEIFATISKLRTPEAFVSWCNQITEHQIINYFREYRRRLKAEVEYQQKHAREVNERKKEMTIISEYVSLLPPKQAEVVRLHVIDGIPVKEIATMLNIPEGTVKSRLYYSRERLKGMRQQAEEISEKIMQKK